VRQRRDFNQLLQAIKVHALLHREHRKRGTNTGAIMATFEDYAAVRTLLADLMAETAEVKMRKAIPPTVEAVRVKQGDSEDRGATVKEVAKHLGLDTSSTRRRLYVAIDEGYIVNLETRPGRPARYRTTRDARLARGTEAVETILPTVDQLAEVARQRERRRRESALAGCAAVTLLRRRNPLHRVHASGSSR
jgi:transposase-like protein